MLWFRVFSPFSIAVGVSSEGTEVTLSLTGVSAGVLGCGLASSPEPGVEVRILGTPLGEYQYMGCLTCKVGPTVHLCPFSLGLYCVIHPDHGHLCLRGVHDPSHDLSLSSLYAFRYLGL